MSIVTDELPFLHCRGCGGAMKPVRVVNRHGGAAGAVLFVCLYCNELRTVPATDAATTTVRAAGYVN
jgi:hypothetical protein